MTKRREKKCPERIGTDPSPMDKERDRKAQMRDRARENMENAVRGVLSSKNGEFSERERRLFDFYFFEEKEDKEVMEICGMSPDVFWNTVDSSVRKMRKYVRNFNF